MTSKKIKKIKDSFKYLQPHDFVDPFIFIFAFFCSLPFRLYNKITNRKIWLICEDGYHARDNGYCFFKYIRCSHPYDLCFFVLDKRNPDYEKVRDLGNIIQFRSLKHWIYYLTAQYNISNQKQGNPSMILFYIIHVSLGLYKNRVFLQHGITKDYSPWLFYPQTKFRYLICGARDEYDYISDTFGYPEGHVIYTGFPRFDYLELGGKDNTKQILLMPTWREWLIGGLKKSMSSQEFKKTEYFKNWNKLLNNHDFIDFIKTQNIEVLFYLHANAQKYLHCFTNSSENIKFLDFSTDIQTVLKTSSLMITDYSSVAMDFAYMEKPVVYFQFDYDRYRSCHLQKGYFDYQKDGFGKIASKSSEVIEIIQLYYKNDFKVERKYMERMRSFFDRRDDKNSKRIYDILKKGA